MFSFEKLPGLSRDRIVDAIAPVLRSHGLVGVELVWRTDERGRVLQVTVERAPEARAHGDAAHADASAAEARAVADAPRGAADGGSEPSDTSAADAALLERGGLEQGAGVTLDLCAVVSRDLSTALDVAEAIDTRYRLEVGTPGIERPLYTLDEYRRFRGRRARLKLKRALSGQYTLEGRLVGAGDDSVQLELDGGEVSVPFADIGSGRLAVDWQALGFPSAAAAPGRAGKRPSAAKGATRPRR